MGTSVLALKQQLFGSANYVCGGHGARWPGDKKFVVPEGITIHFYIHDTQGLPNDIGQKVEQVLTGGAAPKAKTTYGPGTKCWDYRLFYAKAGGYLNLKMSTTANQHYITTDDKDVGIHLSEIINNHVIPFSPVATIYWAACRSLESGVGSFPVDKAPKRTGALAKLASKTGKVTHG